MKRRNFMALLAAAPFAGKVDSKGISPLSPYDYNFITISTQFSYKPWFKEYIEEVTQKPWINKITPVCKIHEIVYYDEGLSDWIELINNKEKVKC